MILEVYDPTIEDSYIKHCRVDDVDYQFNILDCAGDDETTALRELYTRKCQGILLVYDITNRSTFNDVDSFREECCRKRNSGRIPVVLCGNKTDLAARRAVTTEEGKALADTFGWPFIETSARTGENVEEAFFTVLRTYRSNLNDNDDDDDDEKKKCIIC